VAPELDRALCASYPKIFADRHASEFESPMGRGFAIDDGWYRLVDALCRALQRETDRHHAPQVVATQVKQKFGSLRFRVRTASERQWAMIDCATLLSMRMCEICGTAGRVRHVTVGGIATRCDRHAKD
jgi:hypothetical protein